MRANIVNGDYCIPNDEIPPLPKAVIQSFLWVVLESKNDANWKPDISEVPLIQRQQLVSVFKQLIFRNYIDSVTGDEDVDALFEGCRITRKGIELTQSKRLPGSRFSGSVLKAGIQALWLLLLESIPQWLGASN